MSQSVSGGFATDLERIKFAMGAAGIGVWEIMLSNKEVVWDERCCALFGFSTPLPTIPLDKVFEFIHTEDLSTVTKALQEAIAGVRGGALDVTCRITGADGVSRWINATGTSYFDTVGQISRFGGVVRDVTDQVAARLRTENSEAKFRSLVEEAPFATTLYAGPELIVDLANEAMIRLWGKGPEVVGMPLAKALPELEGQPFLGILQEVFETGIPYVTQEQEARLVRDGRLQSFWFTFTYKPLRNAAGEVYAILNMAVEVTEQVQARKKIHESEARFRALIEEAPIAACLFTGPEMKLEIANDAMLQVISKDSSVISKPFVEAMPEIKDQPFPNILARVFTTGEAYTGKAEPALVNVNGQMETYYFDYVYKPLRDGQNRVYGIMTIATDVTERALLIQKLRESETNLKAAIELAELATWNIDMATKEVTFSERLQGWLGVEKAISDGGDSPFIHPNDRSRIKAAMQKATAKGSNGHYDEVYTIVNQQSGRTRVIHATGQTQFDESGNALRLTGTAQDVTMQRDLQSALEAEVQTRTEQLDAVVSKLQNTNDRLADLNEKLTRSNEELGQYAYVASHDLQEPLRKIQLFADLLRTDVAISEKSQQLIGKIISSSARMSQLIQGLLEFSRLLQSEPRYAPVNLNQVLEEVQTDLELVIAEKQARIILSPLPTVEALGLQMNQLFLNLMGNGLKFTKPDTPPLITITAEIAPLEVVAKHIRKPQPTRIYHQIQVQDNGIGFEDQYAEQIFEVFKRLHGRDKYPGAGIGLALCRRIAANHGGALYTQSIPGKGTTFFLLLPGRKEA